MSELKSHIESFKNAIKNLDEVLRLRKTNIVRDSAIKRFELCFDLSWKCIKEYAKIEGQECASPRQCFKMAYKLGLVKYDAKYLEMIKARNITVHTYNQEIANYIYRKLRKYLKLFSDLASELSKRMSGENLF